jgi:hypothetical protein
MQGYAGCDDVGFPPLRGKLDRDLWLYAVCRKAPTMKYVNRSAVLIKAKQPFQDWANELDSDGPQFDVSKQDGMVY